MLTRTLTESNNIVMVDIVLDFVFNLVASITDLYKRKLLQGELQENNIDHAFKVRCTMMFILYF